MSFVTPVRSVPQVGSAAFGRKSVHDAILEAPNTKRARMLNDVDLSKDIETRPITITLAPMYWSVGGNAANTLTPGQDIDVYLRDSEGKVPISAHVVTGIIPVPPGHNRYRVTLANYILEHPLAGSGSSQVQVGSSTVADCMTLFRGECVLEFPTQERTTPYRCYSSRLSRMALEGDTVYTGLNPTVNTATPFQYIRPFVGTNVARNNSAFNTLGPLTKLPEGLSLPVEPGCAANGIKNMYSEICRVGTVEVFAERDGVTSNKVDVTSKRAVPRPTEQGIPFRLTYYPMTTVTANLTAGSASFREGKMNLFFVIEPLDTDLAWVSR